MGSKYSSELKHDHNHGGASASFTKTENENESLNIFQLLGCWRCICFRHFKSTKSRMSMDSLDNNNISSGDPLFRGGNDDRAIQFKPDICFEKKCNEKLSESQVEIYQNNQNIACERTSQSFEKKSFNQRSLDKSSISLKFCRNDRCSRSVSNNIGADVKKNFLSRLMSLSVDGKHRLGYVKQVNVLDSRNLREYDAEEDESEIDELLDGRSYDRRLDFLMPVDSMEYFDSTPSTEDRFTEACLKFQNRTDNLSSDLYEESCLENLESFCDKSILLASMDTIDLGSSIESLLPESQDNIAFDGSSFEEDYVLMDLTTYKSLVDELETCRMILSKLESLLSSVYAH